MPVTTKTGHESSKSARARPLRANPRSRAGIVDRYGDLLDRVSFYTTRPMAPEDLAAVLEGFHRG